MRSTGSRDRGATLLIVPVVLVVGGIVAFAVRSRSNDPQVKVMNVSLDEVGGTCKITHADATKKIKKSDQDTTLLLRLSNDCATTEKVLIKPTSALPLSCVGQPPNAVIGTEFPIPAGAKAYIDCTVSYTAYAEYKVSFTIVRVSELALEVLP